jgi:hypothetical protein
MDFSGQPMFLSFFAGQGVLNKDPRVWLDGAKPPLIKFNYECSKVIIRRTQNLDQWGDISCQFLPPCGNIGPRYVAQLLISEK